MNVLQTLTTAILMQFVQTLMVISSAIANVVSWEMELLVCVSTKVFLHYSQFHSYRIIAHAAGSTDIHILCDCFNIQNGFFHVNVAISLIKYS